MKCNNCLELDECVECSTCKFWNEKIAIKNDPRVARIGGEHYYYKNDDPKDLKFSGHGGREFIILFNDGRIVVTKNLWYQGQIPKDFQRVLTDNAKFEEE